MECDVSILLLETDEVYPIDRFIQSFDWNEEDSYERRIMGINQVDGILYYGHPYLTVIG